MQFSRRLGHFVMVDFPLRSNNKRRGYYHNIMSSIDVFRQEGSKMGYWAPDGNILRTMNFGNHFDIYQVDKKKKKIVLLQ